MNGWRIVRIPVALGRSLGLGRNALRRHVDRMESVAVLTAIVLALLAMPFALTAGTSVYQANLAQAHAQAARTHQATGVLLEDAPTTPGLDSGMGTVSAQGRWRAPNGAARTGVVDALPGEKAGSTVSIWIDGTGQVVDQPVTADQAYWRGLLTEMFIMLGVVCVLIGAVAGVRWLLDRKRYAAWDADWSETEPRWTQRAR